MCFLVWLSLFNSSLHQYSLSIILESLSSCLFTHSPSSSTCYLCLLYFTPPLPQRSPLPLLSFLHSVILYSCSLFISSHFVPSFTCLLSSIEPFPCPPTPPCLSLSFGLPPFVYCLRLWHSL